MNTATLTKLIFYRHGKYVQTKNSKFGKKYKRKFYLKKKYLSLHFRISMAKEVDIINILNERSTRRMNNGFYTPK